jgi:hypothetical protein
MAAPTFGGHAVPLVGTHTHPLYSEDRCGYVGPGDLEVGEGVRTAEGMVPPRTRRSENWQTPLTPTSVR